MLCGPFRASLVVNKATFSVACRKMRADRREVDMFHVVTLHLFKYGRRK